MKYNNQNERRVDKSKIVQGYKFDHEVFINNFQTIVFTLVFFSVFLFWTYEMSQNIGNKNILR